MLYLFNPDLTPLSKNKRYGKLEKKIYFSIKSIIECKKRFKIELTFFSKTFINNKSDYILIEKELINSNKIEILDIDDYTEPTKIIEEKLEKFIEINNEENRNIFLDGIEENKEFFIGYTDESIRTLPILVFYDPEKNKFYSKKIFFKVPRCYYSESELRKVGIKNFRELCDKNRINLKEKLKREISKKYLNSNIIRFYYPSLSNSDSSTYGNFKIFNLDIEIKRDSCSNFWSTFTLNLILKYKENILKIEVVEFSKSVLPYEINSRPRIETDQLLKIIPYSKLIEKIKLLEKQIIENNPVKFIVASNIAESKNTAYIFKEGDSYSVCFGVDDYKIPLLNSIFLKCMQKLNIQILGMNFIIYADKEFLLEHMRFSDKEIIIKNVTEKESTRNFLKRPLFVASDVNFEFIKASIKSQLSKDEWNSLMLLSEIDT